MRPEKISTFFDGFCKWMHPINMVGGGRDPVHRNFLDSRSKIWYTIPNICKGGLSMKRILSFLLAVALLLTRKDTENIS